VKRRGFRLGVGALMGMIAVVGVGLWGVTSWERAHRNAHLRIAGLGALIAFDRSFTDCVWEPTEDQLLRRAYWLSLIGSRISDSDLERLCRLANPSTLFLADTKITDRGLEHLINMQKLQFLDLQATQITDAGIDSLRRLPNLRGLAISHTRITDEGIKRLKQALPRLIIYNSGN
jgi:hypothetical protein